MNDANARNGRRRGARCRAAAAALALLVGAGCQMIDRRTIEEPITDRVIEVKSGDRWTLELDANPTTGYTWVGACDSGEVDLAYDYLPPDVPKGVCGASGKMRVTIRVRRGFADSATVTLKYMRTWSNEVARTVTIVLHRHASDEAFWR